MLSLTRNAEIVAAVNPAGSAAVVGELGGNPRFIRLVELIRKDMDKHARRKTKLEKKYGPASGFNRDHMLGAATAAIVARSDDFNTARAEYGTNYAELLTTASKSRVLCALATCLENACCAQSRSVLRKSGMPRKGRREQTWKKWRDGRKSSLMLRRDWTLCGRICTLMLIRKPRARKPQTREPRTREPQARERKPASREPASREPASREAASR